MEGPTDSVQFFLDAHHFSGQYHNDQLAVQQRHQKVQERLEKAQRVNRRRSLDPPDRPNNQGKSIKRHQSYPSLQAQNFQGQTPLSEDNVAIGNIVFLQLKDDYSNSIKCIQSNCKKCIIDDAAFNHPAVILHIWKDLTKGELMALCCTISGNRRPNGHTRSLPISRFPKTQAAKESLTIHDNETMYREKAGTMIKQSYILNDHVSRHLPSSVEHRAKTFQVWKIPFSKMRPFNVHQPFDNRLSQESYTKLMQSVNFPPAAWIQTSDLEKGDVDPATKATNPPASLKSDSITTTKKSKKSKSESSKSTQLPAALEDSISELSINDI